MIFISFYRSIANFEMVVPKDVVAVQQRQQQRPQPQQLDRQFQVHQPQQQQLRRRVQRPQRYNRLQVIPAVIPLPIHRQLRLRHLFHLDLKSVNQKTKVHRR